MRKIMLIMLVITIGAPVLRATMATDLDPHVQRSAWTVPGLGVNLGGTSVSSIARTIAATVMGREQTSQVPQSPQTPQSPKMAAAPQPGVQTPSGGQSPSVTRPPMAAGPADAQGRPAAPPSTGLARGAEGIVTPELLNLLNPTALPGRPGGTQNQGSPANPAAAASADPAARQMLQTVVEQARANPNAFRDQLGAVNRALGGKRSGGQ